MARSNGTVGWVQVGTDDPEGARRFYGELFGWTFTPDPNSGGRYDLITFPGAAEPAGGIADTGGELPNHAIFLVVVADVGAAVAEAERLGGKVLVPPTTTPTGLVFADLLDPSGNHFGVYAPPAG
ncbi:MAG TPA: VOC family protein [Actinophytocola sp.]|uniref:VOC family protein n=1 Tax=Actinophytocola sp. TaxID=1872138 RepID=UPI002DDD05B8|nr:VOC family protein [Actinophytocola sp.]HEV2780717.1 VOC family protein [Actinophytocola sp.]